MLASINSDNALGSSSYGSEAAVLAEAERGARVGPRGHGGRPSRLESAQLSDRILDVATALFLGHGFGTTSIEAVARRAGISKRTFYHRFRGKEVLFEAAASPACPSPSPAFPAAPSQGARLPVSVGPASP